MKRYLRRTKEESGQAVLEIALTLPLLLVIVLGVVDLSKAYNYWNDSNDLANRGARYAAVSKNPGATATPATNLANYIKKQAAVTGTQELSTGGGDDEGVLGSGVQVCVAMPEQAGDAVEVTLVSEYGWLGFLRKATGVGVKTTIRGRADMRLERAPTATDVSNGVPALNTTQCSA